MKTYPSIGLFEAQNFGIFLQKKSFSEFLLCNCVQRIVFCIPKVIINSVVVAILNFSCRNFDEHSVAC